MLSLARLASFAVLFLSVFTLAHANPAARRAATNAERLARGLAPARPKRLYSGSRTNVARAVPSPVPGAIQTGRIGVYQAGTTATSALRKREDAIGFMGPYGVDTNPASPRIITYTFTEPDPVTSLVELNWSGTPYRLAAVAQRSGPQVTLGPGNTVQVELQNVRAHTAAGSTTSTYVYDTYAIGYAQTYIFTVDPATGKLAAHWVNPDGTSNSPYIVMAGTNLYLTGDVDALQSSLGATSIVPVDIYFEV